MRYTVISSPFAQHLVADIWLRATDRQAVANASDRIDAILREDPSQFTYVDADGRRNIVVPPLVITFDVDDDDRKVFLLSVRYKP